MNFLEELNFSEDEIKQAENNVTDLLIKELISAKDLVIHNLKFLQEYGIDNYKQIYINYSRLFLMDPSKFQKIFTKYEKKSLLEKLNFNIDVVEFL